jgi:hypothetical protein
MNQKSYSGIPALIISTFIFSTLIFLTSCSSSSGSNNHLSPPPVVSITATGGGGQGAAVGAPFTNPLTATVTTGGTPTNGVSVTFISPGSTDGTFAGGVTTATATTNSSGVATSPAFIAGTTAGTYTLTASAPGATATASFTLTNTLLAAGNYVYYLAGEDADPLGPGPYFVVGVFTVNSSGVITGGEQSFDDDALYEQDNILSSGSKVAAGNNGNVLITLNTGDAKVGEAGVETFDASMVSSTNGVLTEYDASASGSGTLELQTSLAAPSGGYAFFLGGVDFLGGALLIGGVINIDNVGGAGNISGAGSVFDESDDGVLSPDELFAASSVTGPDALGQVVFTLNPQTPDGITINEFTMVGYVVDTDHIRWVENQFQDSTGGNTGGVALGQGSKAGTYSSADISGSSGVFGTVGADTNGPLQTAGLLTFNSDGSISGNVSFNDFVVLSPQGGSTLAAEGSSACTSGTALTPCYSIDGPGNDNDGGTGRISIRNVTDSTAAPTFNYNFQLYLAHAGAVVISMDANDWSAGLGYAQTGAGSFSASSFSGIYTLNVSQQDTDSTSGFEYDGIGTVTVDGTSSSLTGFLDLNGILGTPLTPTPGTAGGVTGTFTANTNGVFTGTMTGSDTVSATTADKFTFYLIGATSGASVGAIGIENDTEQLTLATFELQ